MSNPQYRVCIHHRAQHELDAIPAEPRTELRARCRQLGTQREPTAAPYVKQISDHNRLFAVRVDGYRALCTLAKPELRILLVDTRRRVYDRLDTALERGGLS